ncbi:MAG: DUF420 domain-containing protein [Magnetovibrio sp.]|nr:DUF420 domain-containing protein [Magnetovibrio sp.]
MIELTTIPHINAVLNGVTVLLLLVARGYAKSGNTEAHKKTMLVTLIVSSMFLALYVTYHFGGGFAKFGGEGLIRWIYFPILIVHVIGAVVILPLVPTAVFHAIKGNLDKHRSIVKWTWPIWFFVATSGVVVYVMAFHIFPCSGACLATGINVPGR